MRKVVETQLGSDMGPTAYTIGLERKDKPSVNVEAKVELKTELSQEVMVRGAEVIRKVTGWTDLVDTPSIHAFVALGRHEVSVEEKRRREAEDQIEEEAVKRRSTRLVEFAVPPQPSSEASTSKGPENMEGVEKQSAPPSKKEGKKEKESSGKACPAVKTRIGDVEEEQHFFIQDNLSYPIILGQPYIISMRMETKVMDDSSHYARIKSRDGKRTVQFQTVKIDHERNRDMLREEPLTKNSGDSWGF
ncbi:hypothetical protein R1sor_010057 [Riccia sorocarpa]|uniref:Uncharacterized protein n=1 Tax=Riccia sorocarpa TaxID=122646 RepID=A0ABD3I0Y7_9MARC